MDDGGASRPCEDSDSGIDKLAPPAAVTAKMLMKVTGGTQALRDPAVMKPRLTTIDESVGA